MAKMFKQFLFKVNILPIDTTDNDDCESWDIAMLSENVNLFKKLLFTMENATAADSSQSNISRIYIWKDKKAKHKEVSYYKKWSSKAKMFFITWP